MKDNKYLKHNNMINAKELYPEYWKEEQENGDFYGPYDYQPIIDSLGNVLVQVDDADYQGDTRVLYESNGKYGYLVFGWGSCSGCDALQACDNMQDIQNLIEDLQNSIKWFDTLSDLKTHFGNKDWELDWSYHVDETKDFIEKVMNYEGAV